MSLPILDLHQPAAHRDDGLAASEDTLLAVADALPRTLIANSSLQYFDLVLESAVAGAIVDRYFEARETGADAEPPSLFQVELDENGVYYHPLTETPVDPSLLYAVDGRKALEAFRGAWVPLPVMRVIEDPRDGSESLGEGPSNWVRAYIESGESVAGSGMAPGLTNGEAHYRVVVAVDTALEPAEPGPHANTAPTLEDANAGRRFRFSADVGEVGWFVTESWVDEWLVETFREQRPRAAADPPRSEPPRQSPLEHLAHYLTLLNVLEASGLVPDLQLLSPKKRALGQAPITVDLVLDIGASRTCALLAEAAPTKAAEPIIAPLLLRDLSRPTLVHQGHVSSRIEFARASFGKDVYSRWSGRTNAFYWPSLARIGDEAVRLASEQSAADAFTGLSSPIRYLWDGQASRHVWRFSGAAGGAGRRNSLISGHLLAHLTEAGDVLEPGAKRTTTTKPRFSRSSLMTFFAAELIEHALVAINSPDYREARDKPTTARRLGRIVVTVPTAMQQSECRRLTARVEAAVRLVWQSHGWHGDGRSDVLAPPAVVIADDGATATQIAFLENEIGAKFQGKGRQYLGLVGKPRTGYGTGRSLRIATLDIGGGTTGLAVATYALGDTGGLVATPELSEGFAIGGDDVLKVLIEGFVLPAIERKLTDSKLVNARQFMKDLVNAETHGRASRIGEFRRRFASELAMPAAIALLQEHETLRANEDDRPAVRTLRSLLAGSAIDPTAAAAELQSLASDEGSDSFTCLDAEVAFTLADVVGIARRLLAPVVTNAARTMRALDCDMVLLSGWLSRMPVVKEMFLDSMPIRPDRILPMHEYRMGAWFPGRLAGGSIHDPKPLAAVGALIASRPGERVGGLPLVRRPLDQARRPFVIGRLGADGLIGGDAVLFEAAGVALDGADSSGVRQTVLVTEPPAMLGFRRSPLASWPALPLAALQLADMPPEQRPRMPIRVTLGWSRTGRDGSDVPWIIRATDADGTELASSELSLGAKSLGAADGHWLDTGVFAIA
ncbi:MAG: virulence factor SrfB [Hyphomicrobiaceae bacterium]